jgi:hypothetical protein
VEHIEPLDGRTPCSLLFSPTRNHGLVNHHSRRSFSEGDVVFGNQGPNDTEDPDLLVDRILVALGGTTYNLVEATGRRKSAPAINVLHLL